MKLTPVVLSSLAIIFTTALYAEDEEVIQFAQAPVVVQRSILQQVALEHIKKIERISDEGNTKYEVESVAEGVSRDISFAENGQLLEIETGTSLEALPASAKTAITNEFPSINIHEIESVQLFYYEVEGQVDGKTVKFRVLATGDIEDSENSEVDDGAN